MSIQTSAPAPNLKAARPNDNGFSLLQYGPTQYLSKPSTFPLSLAEPISPPKPTLRPHLLFAELTGPARYRTSQYALPPRLFV
jgi:hypothetical protein